MDTQRYVGLMSGTSIDAIDAALVEIDAAGSLKLVSTHSHPMDQALQSAIGALCTPGENEIDRLGDLDRQLGAAFAQVALTLIGRAQLRPEDITAIGSHGQTIRHRPLSASSGRAMPFTLQIGDPNTIAEESGITTVGDFRRRDVAAGGEGAPLVPAFHRAQFARPGLRRAIVNIGGIANATLLDGLELSAGFDCGPGNTLLDYWIKQTKGVAFDASGAWSAAGKVDNALLDSCLDDPFFALRGPRSTGREYFSPHWLQSKLGQRPGIKEVDVQATLAELTACAIARSLNSPRHGATVDEVYICGGGAHNADIMRRLSRLLGNACIESTEALGLHPDWVEAAAFAWLARQRLTNQPGNAPEVTGARGLRVLGTIYPGATASA